MKKNKKHFYLFFSFLVSSFLQASMQSLHDHYSLIDLTHTLDEKTPTVPGKTPFQKGVKIFFDQWQLMDFSMSSGIGTHIDAPLHLIKNGRDVSMLTLDELVVPACVIVIDELAYDKKT